MVPRVVYMLFGSAFLCVAFMGLLGQRWALLVEERAAEMADESTAALRREHRALQALVESETAAKLKALQEKATIETMRAKALNAADEERKTKETALAQVEVERAEKAALWRQIPQTKAEAPAEGQAAALQLGCGPALEAERAEKVATLAQYDELRRTFEKEVKVWSTVREQLEAERKERLELVARYNKLRAEWSNYTKQADLYTQSRAEVDCASHCAIVEVHLEYDVRFFGKAAELREKLAGRAYPTFEELYGLVMNKPYDENNNVWHHFPNPYNMAESFAFPFSNLHQADLEYVFDKLGRKPDFMVEVGSFHGHSAVVTAKFLEARGYHETPMLCIDPWVGDLGELLYRDDWETNLVPGEITDGRSTSYFQFMTNIKSQIAKKEFGPRHIIPLAVTSTVGARYLLALGLTPDLVYLDSAHEKDETFTEMSMYWGLISDGGVLYGDDFTWPSVSHDVKRFAEQHRVELNLYHNSWVLQKPR